LKEQLKAPSKSTISTVLDAVSIQKTSNPVRVAGVYLLVLLFSFGIFYGKFGPSPLTTAPAFPSILPQSVVLPAEDHATGVESSGVPAIHQYGRGGRGLLQTDKCTLKDEGLEQMDTDLVEYPKQVASLLNREVPIRVVEAPVLSSVTGSKEQPIVIDDLPSFVLDLRADRCYNSTIANCTAL